MVTQFDTKKKIIEDEEALEKELKATMKRKITL